MARSKATIKIFKVKIKFKDISDEILKRTYKDPMMIADEDKKKIENIDIDEYKLIYSWDKDSVKKAVVEFENKKVSTIISNAVIEIPRRRKKNGLGQLLPKKDRIKKDEVKTIFFEYKDNVYVLLNTSKEADSKRVQWLIDKEKILNAGEEFKLDEDLFNWLFYVNKECGKTLTNKWKIDNITGFVGNVSDEENIFKGTSDYTTDLIITKAFISNKESLTDITVKVNSIKADLIFSVDNNSNTILFVNRSSLYFESVADADEEENLKMIYLYTSLIPRLKELYINDKQLFLRTKKDPFFRKMGLEVIESIMNKNDISLSDIKNKQIKTILVENVV